MLNVILVKQLRKIPLPGTPYTLMGASDKSHVGFFIPELGVKLDAGIPTDSRDKFTFLTSKRRTHICELPADFLESTIVSTVFTHYPKKITDFVCASLGVTKHRDTMPNWTVIEMAPSVPKLVTINKTRFQVMPISTSGYGFTEIRQKLKPEYLSLSQTEINKLSKDGVSICADQYYPHFCYFGEVDWSVLIKNIAEIIKYRTVIIPAPSQFSDWTTILPIFTEHPDITFILHGNYYDCSIPKNVMHVTNSYDGALGVNGFFDTSVTTIDLCPGLTLTGASEAARHTGFFVPELGISLDAGVPTDRTGSHVFISHGHWDHVRNLPCLVGNVDSSAKLDVYIPCASTKFITQFVTHSVDHEFGADAPGTTTPPLPMLNWNLVPMTYTDCKMINVIHQISGEKIVLRIEPFKCTHSCPCIGYGFIKVDVETGMETPLFCFLGDTDHRVMSNEYAKLIKYQTIIVECTFFEPSDKRHAKKDKHMFWDNLIPFIRSHPEIRIILYHFSCRYKPREIISFFSKCGFHNVVPFVNTYKSKKSSASSSDSSPCGGAGFGAGIEDD